MKKFVLLPLLALLFYITPAQAVLTPSVNVTGTWSGNGSLAFVDPGSGVSCSYTGAGTVTFNQTGNTITGNYSFTWVMAGGPVGICGALGVTGAVASPVNNGVISATQVTFIDNVGSAWSISFTSSLGQGSVAIPLIPNSAKVALQLTTPSLPIKNTPPPPPPPVVAPPAQCGQPGNSCARAGSSFILMTPAVYSNKGSLVMGGRWTNITINLGGPIIPLGWYPSFTPPNIDKAVSADFQGIASALAMLAEANAASTGSTPTCCGAPGVVSTTTTGGTTGTTTTSTTTTSTTPNVAGGSFLVTLPWSGSCPGNVIGWLSFPNATSTTNLGTPSLQTLGGSDCMGGIPYLNLSFDRR